MMTLESPEEHLAVSAHSPCCGVVSLGLRILVRNILCEGWCEHSENPTKELLEGTYIEIGKTFIVFFAVVRLPA